MPWSLHRATQLCRLELCEMLMLHRVHRAAYLCRSEVGGTLVLHRVHLHLRRFRTSNQPHSGPEKKIVKDWTDRVGWHEELNDCARKVIPV